MRRKQSQPGTGRDEQGGHRNEGQQQRSEGGNPEPEDFGHGGYGGYGREEEQHYGEGRASPVEGADGDRTPHGK